MVERIILSVVALLGSGHCCNAQSPGKQSSLHARLESSVWAGSSPDIPFWLKTNRFGATPLTGPALAFRAGIGREYAPADSLAGRKSVLRWAFGFSPMAVLGKETRLLLPEAYASVKFRAIELRAGRWQQRLGLGDSTLSSGFIAGSGNALPIPKVQLGTPGYVSLPFTRNWLAVSAGFAHGWFNVPYIQGSYLHQKYLYARLGKPTGRVNLHLGINHQVQWGGQAAYLLLTPDRAVNGRLPSSFRYFGNVVLGTIPRQLVNDDYSVFDGSYRIGNHLGSVDFAVRIADRRGEWTLYHQHPFEDASGLVFVNVPDGLFGLGWNRKSAKTANRSWTLRRLVVEYLSTMSQSGSSFWRPNSQYQGTDNYFNHEQYREGWSYLGRALGTPFVVPRTELRPELGENRRFYPNNRVKLWYAGLEGDWFGRMQWQVRVSNSRNYGTYLEPYAAPIGQFSALLGSRIVVSRSRRLLASLDLAIDRGGLLPNTVGGRLSIRKSFGQAPDLGKPESVW